MNKLPKLTYKEQPLEQLVNIMIGSTDWLQIAPRVRDWCTYVTMHTSGEITAKVSPDMTVFTLGGNIRKLCNNKIQLVSGNMTINDDQVVFSPQYDSTINMWTTEILFHGVMKIWIGYQVDHSSRVFNIHKAPTAMYDLQYADTAAPPDMAAMIETHGYRDHPIRICSFRVEAENNISYMKAEVSR